MSKNKGIALVPLIIIILAVITVIVILLVFLIFPSQLSKSRDTQRKKDIDLIRTSLFDYYLDFNCYPKTIPDCHNFDNYPYKEYFSRYSCDPKGLNYVYEAENSNCPQYFEIFTILETKNDPSIVSSNCTNGCGPGCLYNFSVSNTRTSQTSTSNCPLK